MPDHPSSTTKDDRVVSIHTSRRYRPAGGRQETQPPSGDLNRYERSGEPDDFRHRMMVNAIAFLFVIGLVLAGVWLADTMTTMRKTQDCVLSGKRGCAPMEAPAPGR
jgi:hypothetical protein